MSEVKAPWILFATSLLILVPLMLITPVTQAKYYENIVIQNNDFWVERIEKPSGEDEAEWKYEISVQGKDSNEFDVYLLKSGEYDRYKKEQDFIPTITFENTNDTGMFNFSTDKDKSAHYFVVDNRDNVRDNDAYANETITVDIDLERKEDEFPWQICCGIGIILVILVLVIVLWANLEPRYFPQAKSRKYLNLTKKPAFQPSPPNPPIELSPPPPHGFQESGESPESPSSRHSPPSPSRSPSEFPPQTPPHT